MNKEFKIECKWLGRETGSVLDRHFYADIGLAVEDDWLTLLEDLEASTVRTHVRGCGYHLAQWFAANWWRLRWEPETNDWRQDADWRIAHGVAGAGGGYVWPNLFFASNGVSLGVASFPRTKVAAYEPVRYLNRIFARIAATEFEQKVDYFVEGVLSRMHTVGIEGDNLLNLWAEVQDERHTPTMAQYRKFEAMCGYDPDDAPDAIIAMLIDDKAQLGTNALEEVAAQGRHSTVEVLTPILALAGTKSEPTAGGFRGNMPEWTIGKKLDSEARPWQQAADLARTARKQWGLGKNPITNEQLAGLMGTNSAVFSDQIKAPTPMPIALRTRRDNRFDIYFDSSWTTTRRFAASRLLGDYLHQPDEGRLLPATNAKTSRQQFQRAFAQEFLCPFEALMEKIQTDQPKEDDIAEAAEFFNVSTWVVQTTLVNKGELDRDTLGGVA